MSALTAKRRMMSTDGNPGLPFIQKPGMVGHLQIFEEDLDPIPGLMDLNLFSDQSFRDRIAVGIDLDIAGDIYGSIPGLIDRRDIERKGDEVRLFYQVNGFRVHTQGTFDLLVGHFLAPSLGLEVEIMPSGEGATSQEIVLHVGKISFYFGFAVSIANGVGDEGDPKDLAETFHFGGHLGLGAAAVSHDDAGVVNNTPWAGALHEAKGGIEKDPGLEAGKGRVILDIELSGITEDQPGTLGLDLFPIDKHLVGRGVVLHFLARPKDIDSGTAFFLIFSQIQTAHDSGQGAVGDLLAVFVLQDLLNPDDIASRALE